MTRCFLWFVLLFCESAYGIGKSHVDTVIIVSNTKVELHFTNEKIVGVILVLPGWNFSQDDICIKSDFCKRAKDAGYIIIMPDMKKSVYQRYIYPETRIDWQKYHTLLWITDTLIPKMRKDYDLLQPGKRNFLFGISTGARGVALLSYNTKNIFKAGAALSGDYNQELMTDDNLMKGYYGTIKEFPSRWNGEDNPVKNVSNITIPLFLAHGMQDKVVPCIQTQLFFNKLHESNKLLGNKLVMKEGAGHDYVFWSSMYTEVFNFFKAF